MFSNPFFDDRADAGEKLAEAVLGELGKLNLTAQEAVKPIVYALPRGCLPVAVPIARRLGCPLDVVVAKKITRPDNLELAIGAATADGYVLWHKQKQHNLRLQKLALPVAQNNAQSLLADLCICAPVAPAELMGFLAEMGDKLIVLETPHPFYSVSRFYGQFPQVETAEALRCLQQQTEWRS